MTRTGNWLADWEQKEKIRKGSLWERINQLKSGDEIKLTPRELGFFDYGVKESDIVAKKAEELGLVGGGLSGSDHIPLIDEPIQFWKK